MLYVPAVRDYAKHNNVKWLLPEMLIFFYK